MSSRKKTLLFCWELGAGNGHIGRFEPLARRFLNAGWRVVLAVRSLSRVPRLFPLGEVDVYQAPFKNEQSGQQITLPRTVYQLLENIGFRDEGELTVLVKAWRAIFDSVRPDLMIFDHSPTALLAARGWNVPQFTMGSGFSLPQDREPLDDLTPWWPTPEHVRLAEERIVLKRINQVLDQFGQPGLSRLGRLYSEVHQNLLLTHAELDHYGPRSGVDYFGSLQQCQAQTVEPLRWPKGSGPRVFAYLRAMPTLSEILEVLTARNVPTIAVVEEVSLSELIQRFGKNISFADRPQPLEKLAQECNLAITYAAHGTMCKLLRAGVPQMMAPMTVEQGILSHKIQALNAGLFARQGDPQGISGPLHRMLDYPHSFSGAGEFQQKYLEWTQEESVERLYQLIGQSC